MDIKQVARLLTEFRIPVVFTNNYLEQEHDQGESYYKVRQNEINNKWEYLFIRERQNDKRVIASFKDESSASKYYYLTELRQYFRDHYIQPFELNNKDINIGEFNFTLENLKEAFQRLNIDREYYSLEGNIKEHSIVMKRVSEYESKIKFIGKNCKEIFTTLEMDNWQAYKTVFQYVYHLFLLDKHTKVLLDEKEITEDLSNNDYDIFLS